MNPLRLLTLMYCGTLAILIVVSHKRERRYLQLVGFAERPEKLLGRWSIPRLSPGQFSLVGAVLVGALVMASIGVTTRVAIGLAIGAYFLYFGQIRGLGSVQRKTDLMPQILAVLWITPGIESTAAGASPLWPLLLMKAVVLRPYFSAGISKLRVTGPRWVDGMALQGTLVEHHLRYDLPAALRLASNRTACIVLSVAVLAFELLCPLALMNATATVLVAIAAMVFHLGTLGLMRINYLKYHAPALIALIVAP